MKPKIIAIVGPTASGKTTLAISLAQEFDGEVISVDSRQIYRGMDIGTAKVEGNWQEDDIEKGGSIGQLFGERKRLLVEGIPHWGIDLVHPDDEYSAAQFKEFAIKKMGEILSRGRVPILAGGTGLWLSAVVDNLELSESPPDPALRAQLNERHIDDLFAEFKRLDPQGAELIDRKNKRRVVRALEVCLTTGKPFSEAQTRGESLYNVLMLGMKIDREELNERINDRVDEMIARGLVDEVRGLREQYGCEIPAMTGIGYRQMCQFLSGEQSLKDAIEDVKKESRRYAKRQMTWFKRDARIQWLDAGEGAHALVRAFLQGEH